jgi:hypothetical protein
MRHDPEVDLVLAGVIGDRREHEVEVASGCGPQLREEIGTIRGHGRETHDPVFREIADAVSVAYEFVIFGQNRP